MKSFAQLLSGFLAEYAPRRRNLSENTLKSYRDAFILLLEYVSKSRGVAPDEVGIEHLGRKDVEAFLSWLSDERGASAATVNVRLSALRSFAGYVSFTEPAYLEWSSGIREIKLSKAPSAEVKYLSVEAVRLVIGCAQGDVRDHALISLLYDTGARVSEIAAARRHDLRLEGPATIRLVGKGSKARIVPVSKEVSGIMSAYLATCDRAQDQPLFLNRRGQAIGRAGIAWVLSKHAAAARAIDPELVPAKVHPHVLRHSKAVHLVEADVNLMYIRDFLGHASVTTTEIYAKISGKTRRKEIEKAAANIVRESKYTEQEKSDIVEWLKSIM